MGSSRVAQSRFSCTRVNCLSPCLHPRVRKGGGEVQRGRGLHVPRGSSLLQHCHSKGAQNINAGQIPRAFILSVAHLAV